MYVSTRGLRSKNSQIFILFFKFLICLGQLDSLYIKFTPSNSINSKNILCWDSSTTNWKIHFSSDLIGDVNSSSPYASSKGESIPWTIWMWNYTHTHITWCIILSQLYKFLNTCIFLLKMLHNILFEHKSSTLHYMM